MRGYHVVAAAAIAAIVPLGAARPHPADGTVKAHHRSTASATDACAMLSDAEVSAALEVTTQPGKPVVPSNTTTCIWTTDANNMLAGRRVTVVMSSLAAFDNAKDHPNTFFTVEPVGGVGDDAFYEIFKSDSPYLVVKKGNAVFTVRVLNGLKLKAFTLEQEKAKELVLGRAASGRV